jgi:hypothetical protein
MIENHQVLQVRYYPENTNMTTSSKAIASIPPLYRDCRNCIYYKLSDKPNQPATCHFMYRQHPFYNYSYFESAKVNREDKNVCGPEGRWFIGKGGFRIDDSNQKKQDCYDK